MSITARSCRGTAIRASSVASLPAIAKFPQDFGIMLGRYNRYKIFVNFIYLPTPCP